MEYNEIIKKLKKKIFSPIYLLMGEEPYFMDILTDYFEDNILTEEEKDFNLTVVYGKDTDSRTIINYSKRFPMMSSEIQIVIVKEAQELKDIEELLHYAESPLPSTILVISHKYKNLDKRSKLYKKILEKGEVFESKCIQESKIPEWINKELQSGDYSINPNAASMLNEFLGNDLGKISNELNKLKILLPPKTVITAEHIEKNIGISKDYNNFELQKAIIKRNFLKANRIINYFASDPKNHSIISTISILFSFFNKLIIVHSLQTGDKNLIATSVGIPPFFVQEYLEAARLYNYAKTINIISILKDYDLKSKGINNGDVGDGELMKEMIFKIMH